MMIEMSMRRKVMIGLNLDLNYCNLVEEVDVLNLKLFLVYKYNKLCYILKFKVI